MMYVWLMNNTTIKNQIEKRTIKYSEKTKTKTKQKSKQKKKRIL